MKTIYIMGYARSGSTLFESMLISKYSVNPFGEIRYFSERGVILNERCSCGVNAKTCDFWKEILTRLGEIDFEKMAKLINKFESSKYFFFNLLMIRLGFYRKNFETYKNFNKKLYSYLKKHGGFIDSSKLPARLFFLNNDRDNKLFDKIYWIVRDPRGVAWSCMKDVERPEATKEEFSKMPKFGYYGPIARWFLNTVVCYYVKKKIKNVEIIKYEDLIKKAEDFIDNENTFKPMTHSISGNPRRFTGGLKKIKLDDEWKYKLSWFKKKIVYVLLFPIMKWFDYEI